MVWPFTSSSSNGDSRTELDPTLQEFVKAQGPVSYSTSQQQQQQQVEQQQNQQLQRPPQTSTSKAPPNDPSEPEVGSSYQSRSPFTREEIEYEGPPGKENDPAPPMLYKDGRYAHLWKTYRPLARIEQERKTSQEKIEDVLLSYKDRDAVVKRIGLENCSAEMIALEECNQGPPTAHDRFTLCRDYTRRLERCYVTQVRFLRAMGYLAQPGRPQHVEDDIQLHADDLYRRMQTQEAMVEEAKKEGKPVPVFAPVVASEVSRVAGARPVVVGTQAADGSVESPTWNDEKDTPEMPALPPEAGYVKESVREHMRDRLRKLNNPEDRAVERLALANQILKGRDTGEKFATMALRQKHEREERRKAGTASIGDYVSGWLGW